MVQLSPVFIYFVFALLDLALLVDLVVLQVPFLLDQIFVILLQLLQLLRQRSLFIALNFLQRIQLGFNKLGIVCFIMQLLLQLLQFQLLPFDLLVETAILARHMFLVYGKLLYFLF